MKNKKQLSLHRKRIAFEKHWARYKYNVMERNYSYYKSISTDIGVGEKGPDEMVENLGEYLLLDVKKKAVINTFTHIWGYFKLIADKVERQVVFDLMDSYKNDDCERVQVKQSFLSLAKKYEVEYLLSSHYFDELFLEDENFYGDELVHWFKKHQRQLIFRENREPYKVWVSEIMCQQTQVATMLPYYKRFMERWPDVFALASADEDAVLKAWEGLGYYGRARRLLECAKVIVSDYKGEFPASYKELVKCPGIGPYTAGAILSICHNSRIAAVDGNVMRVMSRVFNSHLDIAEPNTKKIIEKQVLELIPDDASSFNQGLMELGALICTPTNPKCQECPYKDHCVALGLGRQGILPIKSKAKKKRVEKLSAVLIQCGNQYMFVKSEGEGLLGGLWALPSIIEDSELGRDQLRWHLETEYGISAEIDKAIVASHKHVFTHKIWQMELFTVTIQNVINIDYPIIKWITKETFNEIAVSTAYRKLLDSIMGEAK